MADLRNARSVTRRLRIETVYSVSILQTEIKDRSQESGLCRDYGSYISAVAIFGSFVVSTVPLLCLCANGVSYQSPKFIALPNGLSVQRPFRSQKETFVVSVTRMANYRFRKIATLTALPMNPVSPTLSLLWRFCRGEVFLGLSRRFSIVRLLS